MPCPIEYLSHFPYFQYGHHSFPQTQQQWSLLGGWGCGKAAFRWTSTRAAYWKSTSYTSPEISVAEQRRCCYPAKTERTSLEKGPFQSLCCTSSKILAGSTAKDSHIYMSQGCVPGGWYSDGATSSHLLWGILLTKTGYINTHRIRGTGIFTHL